MLRTPDGAGLGDVGGLGGGAARTRQLMCLGQWRCLLNRGRGGGPGRSRCRTILGSVVTRFQGFVVVGGSPSGCRRRRGAGGGCASRAGGSTTDRFLGRSCLRCRSAAPGRRLRSTGLALEGLWRRLSPGHRWRSDGCLRGGLSPGRWWRSDGRLRGGLSPRSQWCCSVVAMIDGGNWLRSARKIPGSLRLRGSRPGQLCRSRWCHGVRGGCALRERGCRIGEGRARDDGVVAGSEGLCSGEISVRGESALGVCLFRRDGGFTQIC